MKYVIDSLQALRDGEPPTPITPSNEIYEVDGIKRCKIGEIDAALKLLEPEEPEPEDWIDRLPPLPYALVVTALVPFFSLSCVILASGVLLIWPFIPIFAFCKRKSQLAGGGV